MLSPSCKPPFSQQLLHKHSVSDFFLPFFFFWLSRTCPLSSPGFFAACCPPVSSGSATLSTHGNLDHHTHLSSWGWKTLLSERDIPIVSAICLQNKNNHVYPNLPMRRLLHSTNFHPKSAQAVFRIRNGRIKETFNTKKALALSAVTTEKKNWTCEIFWEWITLK